MKEMMPHEAVKKKCSQVAYVMTIESCFKPANNVSIHGVRIYRIVLGDDMTACDTNNCLTVRYRI